MSDEIEFCTCVGPVMSTGNATACPRCGRVSAGALSHRRYMQALESLGPGQPASGLPEVDGGAIDDMLLLFEYLQRERRDLWASGKHDELKALDAALLPWAKGAPTRLVLSKLDGVSDPRERLRPMRPGSLRRLNSQPMKLSKDQLLEELGTRCKTDALSPQDIKAIAEVIASLKDRDFVIGRALHAIDAAGGIPQRISSVFAEEMTAIDRAVALSGLSAKTIEAAAARTRASGGSLEANEQLAKKFGIRTRRSRR